jgi:polysaccharide biosynthesis transport protein
MSMQNRGPASSVALADYGILVRRQAWVVVAGVLVALIAAAGYLAVTPKTYTSTASVLINPITVDPNATAKALPNVDTEAQLVKSAPVAAAAEERLHTGLALADLLQLVSISAPTNTAILDISFDAATPTAAEQGAQVFAESYLANRAATAQATVAASVTLLQTNADEVTKSLQQASFQAGALPANSPDSAFAKANQAVFSKQLSDLQTEIVALKTTDTTPGQIIQSADVPTSPSAPVKSIVLATALALGAMVGLLAAIVRQRADRRIRSTRVLVDELGLTVLGELPPAPRRAPSDALIPAKSPLGQTYVQLRNAIVPLVQTGPGGTYAIAVTRASAGDSSMVAANLAGALARGGMDVALVCADLEGSRSQHLLGIPDGRGLSDVLAGSETVLGVLRRPGDLRHLSVMIPGESVEAVTDRMEHGAIRNVITSLRRSVELVLVEAPSPRAGAAAQTLAMHVDGVLLVVELTRTTRDDVVEALRQLEQAQTKVLGAIVVPRSSRADLRGAEEAAAAHAHATKSHGTGSAATPGDKAAMPSAVRANP